LYLKKLNILNFKNYSEVEISFIEGANCFVGNNGVGKTNLLDAIHYLSLCKSYFNSIDSQNILHDAPFFVVQGHFSLNGNEENIYCALKRGQKKQFKRNQKEYPRLADHIGLLPIVMITPTDSSLITEGSEERRKLIDSIISQFDIIYLDALINYNKVLGQRNALLKQFAQSRRFDAASLEIWDDQLVSLGEKIHASRTAFINKLIPVFIHYYNYISGTDEVVNIVYESQLNNNDYGTLLKQAIDKDRNLQYTSIGIHKDDLEFRLGNFTIKKFGSQGQQKSFLLALKLAQFDMIKQLKNVKPMLLLDDIFDKLDDIRIHKLMELASGGDFGQLFITDTHPERVSQLFKNLKIPAKIFKAENNTVTNANQGLAINNSMLI
jgi:DNA replication and repair protein RecF